MTYSKCMFCSDFNIFFMIQSLVQLMPSPVHVQPLSLCVMDFLPTYSVLSEEESQACGAAVAPHWSLRLSRDSYPSSPSLLSTWLTISVFEANLMQPRSPQEGWRQGTRTVSGWLLPLSSQTFLFSAHSLSEHLVPSPSLANEEFWDVFILF